MTKLETTLMILGLVMAGITSSHAAETGKQAKKLPAQRTCETMAQFMEEMLHQQRKMLRNAEQEMKKIETKEKDPQFRAMLLKNQLMGIDELKHSIADSEKGLALARQDGSFNQCTNRGSDG